MKKIKEVVSLITEGFSALVWLIIAFLIPFSAIQLIVKVFRTEGIGEMPIVQQFIYLILVLWMLDIVVRPIVSKILGKNMDRMIKVFAWQPFEIKEEMQDARCTATAKDA